VTFGPEPLNLQYQVPLWTYELLPFGTNSRGYLTVWIAARHGFCQHGRGGIRGRSHFVRGSAFFRDLDYQHSIRRLDDPAGLDQWVLSHLPVVKRHGLSIRKFVGCGDWT
jgi:hypothetical protein